MSILADLQKTLKPLKIPIETGVFSSVPPDEYIVLTPLGDSFELNADDFPEYDRQEIRISLFSKGNYLKRKKELVKALFKADFTITDRRYIGHEDDTGFHNYAIDVEKIYEMEE